MASLKHQLFFAFFKGLTGYLQATINFDVQYFSPDGKVGNYTSKSEFMSPIAMFNEYGDDPEGRSVCLDCDSGC